MNDKNIDICNEFIEICSNAIKLNVTTINLDLMLHQLNLLLKCDYSILLKYNGQHNEIDLLTLNMLSKTAPEVDIEDLCVLTKFIFERKKIQQNSIVNNIIKNKQHTLYNNTQLPYIFGIEDAMFHTELSILAIPAIHLADICGILILCSTRELNFDLLRSSMYVLGALVTICQPPTKENIYLTLINDAFNCSYDDGFLIADKTKILYTNNNAIDILGTCVANKNVTNVFPCLTWPPANDASYPHMRISSFFSVNANYYTIRLFKQKCETEILGLTDSSSEAEQSTSSMLHTHHTSNQCSSGDLMAYLSHEIRNPIQTISSGVYVLDHTLSNLEAIVDSDVLDQTTEEKHSPQKDAIKKTVAATMKRVEKACKNMSIIVDDVLDISKINNDALTINWSDVNIQHFCDVIYNEFYEKAVKKDLCFLYDISVNVPPTIQTDETRLFQILSNLITNSIKYCDNGNIILYVKYDNVKDAVLFSVSDQGYGILKEEEHLLFTKYGRATSSRKNAKSNGLGLYVSQKLAQLLGGTIDFVPYTINDDINKTSQNGATFTFTHPRSQAILNTQQTHNSQKQLNGSILVINNDINELSLFKLLLQCISYDCSYNLNIETHLLDSHCLTHLPSFNINHTKNPKIFNLIFVDGDIILQEPLTSPVVAIVSADVNQMKYIDDIVVKPFHNNDIKKLLEKHLQK